ncbi:hypothetical protein [Geoalkalibacter subterraneus]|uniref:Uncharacterized protein n=1 Tax=Geoalkalibacter subterraneus TaxID=483547 RepID=A0A0B5FU74_9BACT|nr:hypothetical protein [Geoalkalibacter subterraneus]AJF08209.1 hypothetical protein GSUB_17115 [Geoalkalibacter subterraneus]
MFKYEAVLLDRAGQQISTMPAPTLRKATTVAQYLISPRYAEEHQTCHTELGTHKVEVRQTKNQKCVWEKTLH